MIVRIEKMKIKEGNLDLVDTIRVNRLTIEEYALMRSRMRS